MKKLKFPKTVILENSPEDSKSPILQISYEDTVATIKLIERMARVIRVSINGLRRGETLSLGTERELQLVYESYKQWWKG